MSGKDAPRVRRTKGRASRLLEWRILLTVRFYAILTVRQLYYILVSKFSYPPNRKFYKRLDYHLSKLRRRDPALNMKFVDPTRQYFESKMPFRPIEIFVEKDAIRNFIARIAAKYHLSIQVLRGFASLSMYRKAIARAKKNGVRTILYLGDFDPSGLLIEKVAAKEMGIRFVRIAVTHEQIRRLKLQSIPVNRKDSRSKAYIPKYGRRVWEIESIRPRTLLRIIDEKLRMYVPEQFLEKTASREKASRLVQPIISSLAKRIMKDALSMKRHGLSDQEILRRISEKYR